MALINCRYFSGYKPCKRNDVCDESCPEKSIPKERILLIHLEALGAVMRSTALLEPIKRKYPDCHLTWVTNAPAHLLLKNLPHIDKVLTTNINDLTELQGKEFDVVLAVDKSQVAAGIARSVKYKQIFGFDCDPRTGAILPCTEAAKELWEIGLSDHKKFYVNKKSEIQLATEALELPYGRDDYEVALNPDELNLVEQRRSEWLQGKKHIIGLNTGCANVIPFKKLTIEMHRNLISKFQKEFNASIVLLGGPEDTERNKEIANGLDVIDSPSTKGLRDGFCSMAACDVVLTGDSLGMHMAIALKKWVVAWFGPTCDHEIDLFDRGVHILTKANCSPCWKRSCDKNPMCYDLVDEGEIVVAVGKGLL